MLTIPLADYNHGERHNEYTASKRQDESSLPAPRSGAGSARRDSRSLLGGNTSSIDVPHCFMHERIQEESRAGKNSHRADLCMADLHRAELNGADLERANLEGANLQHANLYQSSLAHARLSGADLTSAGLEDGNLSGADMRQTRLSRAN